MSEDLKKIRLNLARSKEYPNGSNRHGYEFIAPLDETGHIDGASWKKLRDKCRVRRFWGDEEWDIGHLVHGPGGRWAFHYDLEGDEDDEGGYRFAEHPFVPGEYVSIRDDDGDMHTFTVVTVEDI